MKSIVNRMFILLILAIGALFTYSYYYQGETPLVQNTGKNVVFVEIERESSLVDLETQIDEIKEEVFEQAEELQEDIENMVVEEVVNLDEEISEIVVENDDVELQDIMEDVMIIEDHNYEYFETSVEGDIITRHSERSEEAIEKNTQEEVPCISDVEPKNKMAIVITDVSSENIDSVIKYLGDNTYVGLAFNINQYDAMKKAKDAGFDNLIVSVTMEPFNESISLPEQSITADKSAMENVQVLSDVIGNSYMPIAITNHMGSKITSKKHVETMKPIMADLKGKGLGFIDSKSNYYSVAEGVAEEYSVPYFESYTFLDKDVSSKEVVTEALNKFQVASEDKLVLGMGAYSGKFIKALDSWLSEVDADEDSEVISIQEIL